jgi:hypothetical protein
MATYTLNSKNQITKDGQTVFLEDVVKYLNLVESQLKELDESISDSNTSAFGDGWYDGFLEAKRLDQDENFYLENVDDIEVRNMSEHAESKHAELIKSGRSLAASMKSLLHKTGRQDDFLYLNPIIKQED